jgi:hypothetical protein
LGHKEIEFRILVELVRREFFLSREFEARDACNGICEIGYGSGDFKDQKALRCEGVGIRS